MDKSKLIFHVKVNTVRKSRKCDISGFNGYGKYRSNANIPYGYLSQYQKRPGIYYLKNKITGFIYIGSTTNIGSRISKHFSQLKKGNHPNSSLLKDFNLYGIDSFDYGVLELTNDNLLEKEKEYQLKEDSSKLYNLQIRHTMRSNAQTESRNTMNKTAFNTLEYKDKIRKLKQNKIGQFDRVNGHLIKVFNNSDEVCAKFNVAKSTLLGCCNGSKKSAKGYVWHYLDDNGNIIAQGKGSIRTIIKQNEDIV